FAYAKALAEEYKEEIAVNCTWLKLNELLSNFKRILCGEKTEHNQYRLLNFECNKEIKRLSLFASLYHAIKLELFLIFHIVLKKCKHLHGADEYKRMNAKGYFATYDFYSYIEHGICNKKNKYVYGAFQTNKYFKNVDPETIKQLLTVSVKPSIENQKMLDHISSTNSVCVHIRRGDYINNDFYNYLNICNAQYYSDAIDYMESHLDNPTYFVFSNDESELKWIKENYTFLRPNTIFVNLNNCDYEELRLMYNCRHFIISNSTFSWWASYLGKEKNKIVVAPSIWHNIKDYTSGVDIYTDDMIKIHVDVEDNK
ncbi:MAG: alpha-1,2-fucosyltransferase, partial [Oscillospiraceae bacterium]|nr:alpha-1,2-fucosyltransferase [Oscillospiraceae bacterium]